MTPHDRAAACLDTTGLADADKDSWCLPCDLRERIERAIEEAVRQERAACLAIAGRRKRPGNTCDAACCCALCLTGPADIADAIRGRAGPPKSPPLFIDGCVDRS